MVTQQNSNTGSWGGELAQTSLAVLKLLDRAYETGKDPFQTDPGHEDYYMYHENIVKGLNHMLCQAGTYGPGTGIAFQTGYHETYNTGIAMMAIVASKTPDAIVDTTCDNLTVEGLTYKQVVQGCVDYVEWSQEIDGGWRYWLAQNLVIILILGLQH